MSEYYKSLISDDEVIKELIKESKRREGMLASERSRLKPNLNFFQRTVNNLISNNSRIDKSVDTFKTEFVKSTNSSQVERPVAANTSIKKPSIDYAFERQFALQRKLNFIKFPDLTNATGVRIPEIKKINFIKATGRVYDVEKYDIKTSDKVSLNDTSKKTTCDVNNHQKKEIRNKSCSLQVDHDTIYISSDDNFNETTAKAKIRKKKIRKKKKKCKDKLNKKVRHKRDCVEIVEV